MMQITQRNRVNGIAGEEAALYLCNVKPTYMPKVKSLEDDVFKKHKRNETSVGVELR
jgi:hypothetical protein